MGWMGEEEEDMTTRNLNDEITYQRFVKMTPKPRATKKRSGLLPAPFRALLPGEPVGEALGSVGEGVDMMLERVSVGERLVKEGRARVPVGMADSIGMVVI